MAEHTEHIVAPRLYLAVLITLMLLLVLTVVFAFIDVDAWSRAHHLGPGWNTGIALCIAIMKGMLVLLFFMHVKYGSRLTWVFASAGFVWLGIMLVLTMGDYFTRNHPPGVSPKGEPKYILSPEPSPPGPPQIDRLPGQAGSYH